MNKTVNINLGGMVFHIDEDAYVKLTHYFEAIKRSLQNTEGQDEIIKDIELRVAELFTERQSVNKQVVDLKDIDAIITVMGQPEDYSLEEDTPANKQTTYSRTKKLYRDQDDSQLGGVASGLGYYFGIDVVWIRTILVLLFIGGLGFGIVAYIVLWIVTPEASTTSEKLEMKGEPVNLSNIEKKVREEFGNVSSKFKNGDYDDLGNQMAQKSTKIGHRLAEIATRLFQIIAKFIGLFLVFIGLTTLLALVMGVFALGSTGFVYFPWQNFIEAANFTHYPVWTIGLVVLFAVGIPFLFVAIVGFKLLSPRIKTINNTVKYSLLSLWIIALILIFSIGAKQVNTFSNSSRVVENQVLNLLPTDTLSIQFKSNPFYTQDINEYSSFKITQDSINQDVIYSNDVLLTIRKTTDAQASVQIVKEAYGQTIGEAKSRAEQIKYSFKIINNQLQFDNYLLTDLKNKFRDQKIAITLFVPENSFLKLDSSTENYIENDLPQFFSDQMTDQSIFKIKNGALKCLNCPDQLYDDNDTNRRSTLSIDKHGIKMIMDTLSNTKKGNGKVQINSKGIFIQTR